MSERSEVFENQRAEEVAEASGPSRGMGARGKTIGHPSSRARAWTAGVIRRSSDFAIGGVSILGLWYATIGIFDILPVLLPPPHSVAQAFWGRLGALLSHGWTTLVESVVGLGVSIVIGALIAVMIVEIPFLTRVVMPWLVVSQAVPKVAIAPLFVIWFGFGLLPKVVIAFFIAFFPIVISGASGLASIDVEELDLFRTITRSRWQVYRHLKVPRALPQFFAGVKVGATLALVGAIVAEFVSAQRGLGYLIMIANRDLHTDFMFAVFIALSTLGIALFYAVVLVERLVVPWYFALKGGAKGYLE
jgi:NitT/TauT family transport system permease protein